MKKVYSGGGLLLILSFFGRTIFLTKFIFLFMFCSEFKCADYLYYLFKNDVSAEIFQVYSILRGLISSPVNFQICEELAELYI